MREARDKGVMLGKILKWRKLWKVILLGLPNLKPQSRGSSHTEANLVLELSRQVLTDLGRIPGKSCKGSRLGITMSIMKLPESTPNKGSKPALIAEIREGAYRGRKTDLEIRPHTFLWTKRPRMISHPRIWGTSLRIAKGRSLKSLLRFAALEILMP